MRVLVLPAALAFTVLVPVACSSFEASDSSDAGTLGGEDGGGDGGGSGGGGQDGSADASPEAAAVRATKLYVFGGVTVVDEFEEHVLEARVASILDDGSLGPWEPAPKLDVVRSYMTAIDVPGGLLVMAGGNGKDFGQPQSNFIFSREDVGVAADDPPGTWKGAPALGAGNGRWAAPGAFMAGRVYLGGGRAAGNTFTNTMMAAPIGGAPPTLQPWKVVGALPATMADYGLVALGSRLYALGGAVILGDGGEVVTASTSMTSLGADEKLTPWVPAGSLPKPLNAFSVVTDDSRVFVIGGDEGAGNLATNSVLIGSPTATQELAWQESTPMRVVRRHLCAVLANGRLYAIGGAYATVTPVVEVGEVNGMSITWRDTTPLPVGQSAMGCIAR